MKSLKEKWKRLEELKLINIKSILGLLVYPPLLLNHIQPLIVSVHVLLQGQRLYTSTVLAAS
jgi:hypothetical protein